MQYYAKFEYVFLLRLSVADPALNVVNNDLKNDRHPQAQSLPNLTTQPPQSGLHQTHVNLATYAVLARVIVRQISRPHSIIRVLLQCHLANLRREINEHAHFAERPIPHPKYPHQNPTALTHDFYPVTQQVRQHKPTNFFQLQAVACVVDAKFCNGWIALEQ